MLMTDEMSAALAFDSVRLGVACEATGWSGRKQDMLKRWNVLSQDRPTDL